MSRARTIVTNVAYVVLWAVAIWAVLYFLMGCSALEAQDRREGAFTVDADCEQDKVTVEFKLDQHAEDASVEVRK